MAYSSDRLSSAAIANSAQCRDMQNRSRNQAGELGTRRATRGGTDVTAKHYRGSLPIATLLCTTVCREDIAPRRLAMNRLDKVSTCYSGGVDSQCPRKISYLPRVSSDELPCGVA